MTSIAIVEQINDKKITVSTIRKGACGDNCAMCGACNAEKLFTDVTSDIAVSVGDVVRIKSDTGYVLVALCCMFLLPIVAPLVAYFMACEYSSIFSCVLAALVFLFSLVFLFFLSKSKWFIKKITPKIIDKVNKKWIFYCIFNSYIVYYSLDFLLFCKFYM